MRNQNPIVSNILEKYVAKSGDEQRFWDKHVTTVIDPLNVRKNVVDSSLAHTKFYDRKKHRKGYNPGEDADVYESIMFQWQDIHEALDEIGLDEDTLSEIYERLEDRAVHFNEEFYTSMLESVIDEIYETASDDEQVILDEMLASDDGYEDLLNAIFG